MGIFSSMINAGSQYLTNQYNEKMNTANNLANKQIADSTNEWNYALAERQNQMNMALNRENIAFQKRTNDLNWQRQLAENNLTRQREDTAYARAARDMEAAGLSKTLAAGNPASSAAMTAAQAQSPQHKFGYERATMQRYEQKAFKADAIKIDADILDSLQKIKNIQHIGAQTDFQNWKNDFVFTNNMLPGSNALVQGVYALGALVDNALGTIFNRQQGLIPSFTFGFNPASSTSSANDAPAPQTVADIADIVSKGSKTPAMKTLDAETISHMPLETETKKALSRTSDEIPVFSATGNGRSLLDKLTAPSTGKREVTVQEGKSNMRPLPATVGDSASSTAQHKKLSYEDLYLPPVYNTKAKKWALAGLAGALLAGGPKFAKYKNMVDNWFK
ncbi:MAG: hypothetical protein [Microviridae sp.]|nr:MAG: hypothetical protein [Microviridae sp.]